MSLQGSDTGNGESCILFFLRSWEYLNLLPKNTAHIFDHENAGISLYDVKLLLMGYI